MSYEALKAALAAGPTAFIAREDADWLAQRRGTPFPAVYAPLTTKATEGQPVPLYECDPDTIRALLKDAERYRWLKSQSHKDWEIFTLSPVWFVPTLSYTAQTLDAAIDAAMGEQA